MQDEAGKTLRNVPPNCAVSFRLCTVISASAENRQKPFFNDNRRIRARFAKASYIPGFFCSPITGEYLVAMKLRAGREYKYDRSDVIGILWEQEKMGEPLTLDRIKQAVTDLYDSYDVLADDVKLFIEWALENGNYEELYSRVRQAEAENKENLLEYQEAKPGVITNDNVGDIIAALRKRKGQD